MVECKSVVGQKVQVGKGFILAMFKNEAFKKLDSLMKCHVQYAVTIKSVVVLFSESKVHSEECPI